MPVGNPPQALKNVLLSESEIIEGAINWILFLGFGILVASNSFKLSFLKQMSVCDQP